MTQLPTLVTTPPHMIEAFKDSLTRGETGYSPSYGLPELRKAIAKDERCKGWNCSEDDVYVATELRKHCKLSLQPSLNRTCAQVLAPGPHYPPYMACHNVHGGKTNLNIDSNLMMVGKSISMTSGQRWMNLFVYWSSSTQIIRQECRRFR